METLVYTFFCLTGIVNWDHLFAGKNADLKFKYVGELFS